MRYVYRSAVTGEFVPRAYAEANPDTTTRERLSEEEEVPDEYVNDDDHAGGDTDNAPDDQPRAANAGSNLPSAEGGDSPTGGEVG